MQHRNRLVVCAFAIALLGALFLTGCQSRLIKFGIYSVPQGDLPAARELGVDFVVGPGEVDYLNAAATNGLKVLVRGNRYPQHRAVLGHYIWDEPDLFSAPPEQVRKVYQEAKKRSRKPAYLNLSSGYAIEYYSKHADVLMFDWYPVGWLPTETFQSHLRVARLAARPKPFFAVIQLFDWSKYPKLMPANPNHRAPSGAEIKAMTVWAAMEGAAGILYYPFNDGTYTLSMNAEAEAAIKESIEFVRLYEAYFIGARAWGPYPFTYVDRRAAYNANFAPAIAVRYTRLSAESEHLVLIAANTTNREIEVRSDKQVEIAAGDSVVFEPYEVKMFPAVIRPRDKTSSPQHAP